jgi:DNA-binding transcriptional regulator YiaG
MLTTFFQSALSRHRQRLESVSTVQAKARLKGIENPWKARVGAQLARARELAGLSQKELAAKFGHSDSAQLSRWEKGTETPQLAAYFSVPELQQPVVIALATLAEGGVEIHTTIAIRRPA